MNNKLSVAEFVDGLNKLAIDDFGQGQVLIMSSSIPKYISDYIYCPDPGYVRIDFSYRNRRYISVIEVENVHQNYINTLYNEFLRWMISIL